MASLLDTTERASWNGVTTWAASAPVAHDGGAAFFRATRTGPDDEGCLCGNVRHHPLNEESAGGGVEQLLGGGGGAVLAGQVEHLEQLVDGGFAAWDVGEAA